ncbi:MAG: PIN-like domain-containing protein [Aureispira sp.]
MKDFELSASTSLGAYLGRTTEPIPLLAWDYSKSLAPELPVFLDTNVLLGYYQMPLAARPLFIQWLQEHNCYVPDQVQREFKRHSKALQRTHRRHLQPPIPPKKLSHAKEELVHYLQQQVQLLNDYPSWKQTLKALLVEAQHIEQQVEAYNQQFLKQGHDLLRQANATTPIQLLQPLAAIQKRAYKHLKKEFDQAAAQAIQENNKGFGDAVSAYQYRYPNQVFPGLGDVLGKQKNPYGDYFIYHEILKWAAQDKGSSPVFFLTDDSTKKDWLDARGAPYPHYQQHFMEQTGRVLHISVARPLWQQWLKVDATTLLTAVEVQEDVEAAIWKQNASKSMQLITTKNVKQLLKRYYPNRLSGAVADWEETIEYIQDATPYQCLFHLEKQLLSRYPKVLQQTVAEQQNYSQIEVLKQGIGMMY